MSDGAATLVADFPRAVSGYARPAVDDYVRQLGERLEALQSQVQKQAAEITRLKQTGDKAKADLEGFAEKEKALGEAVIMIEHRRASIIQELADQKKAAESEVESVLEAAREEGKKVVELARAQGAKLLDEAQGSTDRAHGEAARILEAARKESEEMLDAALGAGDEARAAAEKVAEGARAEAASLLDRAKADADRVRAEAGEAVSAARTAAEEARSRCADAEDDFQQIKAQSAHYVEIMNGIRASLQTHIAALGAVEGGAAVETRLPIAA